MDRQNFRNADNRRFYEQLPSKDMEEVSSNLGLLETPDIETLYRYTQISKAKTITDLCSGSGRVIEGFLARGFSGQIYSIERNSNYVKEQVKKFSMYSNVHISQKDVLTDSLTDIPCAQFATIIWSAFCEFNQDEQKQLIGKLIPYFSESMVIDNPNISAEKNAQFQNGQYIETHMGQVVCKGWIPLKEDMLKHATFFGLEYEHIDYQTNTRRQRIAHILRKGGRQQ